MPADHGLRPDDDDRVSSDGYSRYSQTISKRSMFRSLTRVGDLPRSTNNC